MYKETEDETLKIFSIAANAMNKQHDRMADSASRVARAGDLPGEMAAREAAVKDSKKIDPPVDLAREAVIQIEADAISQANLNVIKAEDERLGHLLDTFA